MAVIFHEESRTFHIFNGLFSYIFYVMCNGQLGQLYYGRKIHDREDFTNLKEFGKRDMAACSFEGNRLFSLEHQKQEYPSYGSGDMRYPAFDIMQMNGSSVSDFTYESHRIFRGKKKLQGLPATYTNRDDEAETLEVMLRDRILGMSLILSYTVFERIPVLCRNAEFRYSGRDSIILNGAMSLNLDLPDCEYEMVDLSGAWARERYVKTHELHEGVQSVYSLRGHSSHEYNPFFALKRKNADEENGEVIGLSLVYSGNFLGQVICDNYGITRAMIGINPYKFTWTLNPGNSFQTPEALLIYSDHGLNGMSQTFHDLFRNNLVRGFWKHRERPILVNSWEVMHMQVDEEKIVKLAQKAASLGMELFVLDDGWFGKRNDDTTSLGDWYSDKEKFPSGLKGVSEKLRNLGLGFGLWFEPEMISKESQLYRKHPDWMLGDPLRRCCQGRNQYVLDLTKGEVVDYLFDSISEILKENRITYVKWDMNRSITEAYSRGNNAGYQGEVFHRQILGVYRLYERLTNEFPEVLFESCASGGARFDPGMLYYSPQIWTSDNTDAEDRLKIQYGTSMVYPLNSMGCHVTGSPNQQTFRSISLKARGETACFGIFGYELDLLQLSTEEAEEIRNQIKFVRNYRKLVMEGDFYRLISPFENEESEAAWMVVSKDCKEALAGYYRPRQPVNGPFRRLKFQGLIADQIYSINGSENKYYGDELMFAGLNISDFASGIMDSDVPQGDCQSRIFIISAI